MKRIITICLFLTCSTVMAQDYVPIWYDVAPPQADDSPYWESRRQVFEIKVQNCQKEDDVQSCYDNILKSENYRTRQYNSSQAQLQQQEIIKAEKRKQYGRALQSFSDSLNSTPGAIYRNPTSTHCYSSGEDMYCNSY